MYDLIISELEKLKDIEKIKVLSSFFKTGKGEYGEGDKFLGIPVPLQRDIAKKYFLDCDFNDIDFLVKSEYHEVRLTGFLLLCYKYQYVVKKKNFDDQKNIVKFYLNHLEYGNNWDLVDLVCYKVLGHYLIDKDRKILYKLADDTNLWKQRVSIVSTMIFVRNGDFDDAINISKKLLTHKHDLIQKAVGWILREIGKNDKQILLNFLDENISIISRTTLRYSIEKFDDELRIYYLDKLK